MKIQRKYSQPNTLPTPLFSVYQFLGFLCVANQNDGTQLAKFHIEKFKEVITTALGEGSNWIDLDFLMQFWLYLEIFSKEGKSNHEETSVPFLPNLYPYLEYEITEPSSPLGKELVKNEILSLENAMMFDNKFMLGIAPRIYDGIPIHFNGDVIDIVTFFEILCWLKIMVPSEKYDELEHTNRFRDGNGGNFLQKTSTESEEKSWSTITTLICGHNKMTSPNFILQKPKSFSSVHRHISNKHDIFELFFCTALNQIKFDRVPQWELIKYFLNHKESIPFDKKGKRDKISRKIIDLLHDALRAEYDAPKVECDILPKDGKRKSLIDFHSR